MKRKTLFLIATLVLFCFSIAQAQIITQTTTEIADGQPAGGVDIILQNGSAQLLSPVPPSGAVTSIPLGDGTLEDYLLVSGASSANNLTNAAFVMGSYNLLAGSGAGGFINTPLTVDFGDSAVASFGEAFNTAMGAGTLVGGAIANDSPTDTLGTIDISGFSSGTVYLIYGQFRNESLVTGSISGPGATTVTQEGTLTARDDNGVFLTEFSFTNDGTFDTFSYNYFNSDALGAGNSLVIQGQPVADSGEFENVPDSSRARFIGVLFDGVAVVASETLTGTAGDDVIDVREVNGSVTATINGTTQQFASVQSITINSGDGNDQVTFTGAMGVTIDGGNGDDTLTGGSGPDVIMGGAGNDTITGNDGADLLDGGLQTDSGTNVNFIDGGNGPDTIIGGAGVDTIDGGRGADTINTFEGNDIISGGNGNDLINAGTGNDSIAGGPANDTINAGPGDDSVSGGAGQDIILGGSGVDDLLGGPSADDIQGGPGNDTIRGGDGADTLSGGTGDDNVSGNTGSDSISGDAGNDVLSGNSGNDTLIGGGGNDTLTGGADSDLLDGGPGTDTAVDTGERGENNIEST